MHINKVVIFEDGQLGYCFWLPMPGTLLLNVPEHSNRKIAIAVPLGRNQTQNSNIAPSLPRMHKTLHVSSFKSALPTSRFQTAHSDIHHIKISDPVTAYVYAVENSNACISLIKHRIILHPSAPNTVDHGLYCHRKRPLNRHPGTYRYDLLFLRTCSSP